MRHFGARPGARYANARTGFASYFLGFDGEARLEIMQRADVPAAPPAERQGWAHVAITVGSAERVRALTEELRAAGAPVLSEPRTTGDGYFESVVADPDGNRIEIVA